MARPLKQGLDYFPLDVDIDQDDKVQLVEALHGAEGFAIIIKLLMRIYKEGYYYKWGESEQILFSKRVNVNINKVNEVVNDCIKYEIFNKNLFEEYGILTSKGIQKRYFEASKRRKEIELHVEYLLVDTEEIVNANKNSDNANKNKVNDNKSAERKGKESKGKESNNRKRVYDESSIHYQLSVFFLQQIRNNNPDFKEPNLQKWADDIRKMMELDGRNEEQVKYLIEWVQKDSFWMTNILSPGKLRDQFDRLVMTVKQKKQGSGRVVPMKKQEYKSDSLSSDELMEILAKESKT